jgi:phage baseplate assembly protein W
MNEIITAIKYPFAIDRDLGTWMEEKSFPQHVRQMMLQVLFTTPGERINRPDFGCGLRRMVFAPNSEATANLTQVMIIQALDKWLGDLITVHQVTVKAIDEKMEVGIIYLLKASQQKQYLNLEVTV